jgi:hypothetical protein
MAWHGMARHGSPWDDDGREASRGTGTVLADDWLGCSARPIAFTDRSPCVGRLCGCVASADGGTNGTRTAIAGAEAEGWRPEGPSAGAVAEGCAGTMDNEAPTAPSSCTCEVVTGGCGAVAAAGCVVAVGAAVAAAVGCVVAKGAATGAWAAAGTAVAALRLEGSVTSDALRRTAASAAEAPTVDAATAGPRRTNIPSG